MSEFNRMTIVAAAEVISSAQSHSDVAMVLMAIAVALHIHGGEKEREKFNLEAARVMEELEQAHPDLTTEERLILLRADPRMLNLQRDAMAWGRRKMREAGMEAGTTKYMVSETNSVGA